MRYLLIILFTFGSGFLLKAQEESVYDYGSEFIYGVSRSTNSGFISGAYMRYGQKVEDGLFRTFGLEIANVRHPQERKLSAGFYGVSVYEGKDNYLISMRLMYGYDKILFQKANRKGVQINAVGMFGPSIGLVSPYYLRTAEGDLITYSQYQNSRPSPPSIVGSANYFSGLSELDPTIGLNLRGSLLFEFGTFKSSVTGFEVGGILEYYATEVPLVTLGTKNYNFFPSLFISVIFGSRK